jgi:NNP family nitrate/nitrite transporter-like MFS transporter
MERSSEPITRGTPLLGLTGATMGFFFGFSAVALFGPAAKELKHVMALSPLQLGFLVAAPALSGSLLRIPFAAWVDRDGGRRPLLTLLILSIIGMAGLYLLFRFLDLARIGPGFYPLLMFLGVLCGCGIAVFSVGIGQVSYWFPQNQQGWALGWYGGIGNLAPGLFSILLPIVLNSWPLARAYLAWLLFLLLGTIFYALAGRNAWYFQLISQSIEPERARQLATALGQRIFPAGTAAAALKLSARQWRTWTLVFLYFTTFGGFLCLTSWMPIYWSGYFTLGAREAGILTAIFSLTASGIRVFGGTWSDLAGGERTSIIALSVLTTGAVLMALSHSFALSLTAELIVAMGMGVNNAAVFKMLPKFVPSAVGGAAGWVGGLGAFGGFLLPPLMALFVQHGGDHGYARGFLVFVALSLTALGLSINLLIGSRKRPVASRAAPATFSEEPAGRKRSTL